MKKIYKNITDIDNGGLIEQANLDFSKIMASINDINTDKRKAAKLVIEIQVKAHEDDDFADVLYKVKATPLPIKPRKITLPPIVRLKPMNTYPEIDQVETMYLLRVNKDGEVALFEADGGRWRFEAQRRIVEYISARSSYFNLDEDSVSIVG